MMIEAVNNMRKDFIWVLASYLVIGMILSFCAWSLL
jgi:hypothetical protein